MQTQIGQRLQDAKGRVTGFAKKALVAGPAYAQSLRVVKVETEHLRKDEAANAGGIAVGAVIGFALALVVMFVLSPLILDQAAAVSDNPNASATDKAMIGLMKLGWWLLPVLGLFGGGGLGARRY